MLNTNVYGINGDVVGSIELLEYLFGNDVRTDLIRKAVNIERSNSRQKHGASPNSGKRHVAHSFGVGRGMSRVPRNKRGRAAFAPNVVGGRPAHPPKSEKIWKRKINKKEKILAMRSALSAMNNAEMVHSRGHKFKDGLTFPIVIEDAFTTIDKTSDVVDALSAIGVYDDVLRAFRGRKIKNNRYKTPKSILIITPDSESAIAKSARNIIGVEVTTTSNMHNKLNLLAPGGMFGRLSLFMESSIKELDANYLSLREDEE